MAISQKLNKFSSRITQPKSQGASQAMLYGTGMNDADMNKPQVGIGSVWYEGNTCNMHLNDLAAQVFPSYQTLPIPTCGLFISASFMPVP